MYEGGGAGQGQPEYLFRLPESLQVILASEMHTKIFAKIAVFADLPSPAVRFLSEKWGTSKICDNK